MSLPSGIKKMILRELAKNNVGLTNLELSEILGLTRQQVNDSLRESTGNGYVEKGENLGIEGINYTITEKGLSFIGIKLKSPLEQNVKTPVETVKPVPIVTKSPLTQKSGHPALNKIKAEKMKSNTVEKIDLPPVDKDSLTTEIEVKTYPFVTDSVIDDESDTKAVASEKSVREGFEKMASAFVPINEKSANEIKHHVNGTTPDYYKGKSMQVFDVLNEFLTPQENIGFFVGNIIKYVIRFKGKNGKQDLLKARDYLDKLIEATA